MSLYPTTPLSGVRPANLLWICGGWSGQRGEDPIDEYWSQLQGDILLGMFRWLHAGQLRFSELMSLENEEDDLVLRIKHFDPGLKGREERDRSMELVLVQRQECEAIFLQRLVADPPWLVYRLEPDARMLMVHFVREGEEALEADQFRYTRLEQW
jgi:hypothetical protein